MLEYDSVLQRRISAQLASHLTPSESMSQLDGVHTSGSLVKDFQFSELASRVARQPEVRY